MQPTPKSALYLRNKLRSGFLSDGDAISRYIHRPLSAEIPFSFWEYKKNQCCPWWMSPWFAGFACPGGPALPPAFPRAVQTRAEKLNLQQNIQCLVLAADIAFRQTFCTQTVALQRCSEITWVSFCLVWRRFSLQKCWFNCLRSTPHNPGWGELSCKETAAHWESWWII